MHAIFNYILENVELHTHESLVSKGIEEEADE